jgi:hypothetical protein
MAHDQRLGLCTDAEKEESILFIGMVRVMDEQGVLVSEDRLAFLEGNAMLPLIGCVLVFVPYEPQWSHADNVVMV